MNIHFSLSRQLQVLLIRKWRSHAFGKDGSVNENREKKETKVKSRCGIFESCIGFIDLTEVLKNLLLLIH